jgi:hypothetical protein
VRLLANGILLKIVAALELQELAVAWTREGVDGSVS